MIYSFLVSFVIGIFIEYFLIIKLSTALFLFLLSLILFLFFAWNKKEDELFFKKITIKFSSIFACILFLVLGIIRTSVVNYYPDQNILDFVGKEINFSGVIIKEPDVRDSSVRYVVRPNSFSKNLFLIISDRFPEMNYGDEISIKGKLDLPKNFKVNDSDIEFDYVSYLAKDNIHFLIYRPTITLLEKNKGNSIISFLINFKNKSIKNISNVVSEPSSSFIAGVLFGVRQSLGDELLNLFKRVGLIHIVVLSGFNLTIIASIILEIVSFTGKRNLGFLISVTVLILFSIMVGFSATVLRALIMSSIALLAKYLGRPYEALRTLFIAGLIMLIWNPLLVIVDPSFQLSWMATFGLIIVAPLVEKFLSEKISWIYNHNRTKEIISSTFAVQIFLLPILIKMSGIFSPISLLLNIMVLPLIPIIMFFGFLTSIFGFISNIISWPFGVVAYLLTRIVISVTEFFGSIPFSVIKIGTIEWITVFVWYLIYLMVYLKIKKSHVISNV